MAWNSKSRTIESLNEVSKGDEVGMMGLTWSSIFRILASVFHAAAAVFISGRQQILMARKSPSASCFLTTREYVVCPSVGRSSFSWGRKLWDVGDDGREMETVFIRVCFDFSVEKSRGGASTCFQILRTPVN